MARQKKKEVIYPWTGPGHLFHKGMRWLFVPNDLHIESHPIGQELASWARQDVHDLEGLKKVMADLGLPLKDTAVTAGPDYWHVHAAQKPVTTMARGFRNIPNGFLVKARLGITLDSIAEDGSTETQPLLGFEHLAWQFKKDVNGFDSRIVIDHQDHQAMVNWFEDALGNRAHGVVYITERLPMLDRFGMFDSRLIIPWITRNSSKLRMLTLFFSPESSRLMFDIDGQEFLLQGLKTKDYEKDGALDYLRSMIKKQEGEEVPVAHVSKELDDAFNFPPGTVVHEEGKAPRLKTLSAIVNDGEIPKPGPVVPPVVRTIEIGTWEISFAGRTCTVVNHSKTLGEVLRDTFGYTGAEIQKA